MREEKKKDYNQICMEYLESLDLSKGKPSLFLHVCCGPCSTYPLSILEKYFNITIGYINPNIFPKEEYEHRLSELKRFVSGFNNKIEIISYPYDYQLYLDTIKGYENEKEGGQRCLLCHQLRLSLAYEYAYKNKYDYFATVMTVSSKKPSAILNQIGFELEKKYPTTKYLPSDFRKKDGTLKGIIIAREYNLYRQDYCGCSFSKRDREEYLKMKNQEELIG
jgi:predicted adenine nucleotide alpha hydrolase (AANH) superfamily ATPase